MADPVNMSNGNQGGNEERKSNTGLKAIGFVAGGILLLLIGLGLGWYFFYRVQVNVTVQAPPAPPPPPAPKPDPAAVRALEDALEKQKQSNKTIEDQIAKLREALQGNVCTITDPRGLGITPPGPGGAPSGPQTPAPTTPGSKSTGLDPQIPGRPEIKAGPGRTEAGRQEPPPPPPTGTLADLVPVLENATVLILAQKTQGLGTGTGFFVSRDIVLTNNHVVNDLSDDTVFIASRKLGTVLEGKVIGSIGGGNAGGADFAVVRVEGRVPAQIKPLGLGVEPAALKEVVAAGYPGAILRNDRNFLELLKGDPSKAPELVLTKGEVSAVQNRDRGLPSIAHTASISSGNSGGPLIDRCGRVVGINTFVTRAEAGQGGGFAIGATGASKFLRSNNVSFDWTEAACTK